MADAYTTRGGLIKPEVGQHLNTWGDLWNNNGTDLIDKALFGFENISVTGDFSLTSTNGDSTSTQLNKAIRLAGTPTADFAVTYLSKEQAITFVNVSGRNSTIKVSAGTGVTLANGDIALLAYNSALGDVTNISPNRIAGNLTVGGTVTMSGKAIGMAPGTSGTDGVNLNQLNAGLAGLTSVTSPGTLKVSALDTTANYLQSKVTPTATGGISVAKLNGGANETLDVLLAINAMTAYTAPVDADQMPAYSTSGLAHKKITLQNLLLVGWGAQTSADHADSILIYDNSAGVLAKQSRADFLDTGQMALRAGVFSL